MKRFLLLMCGGLLSGLSIANGLTALLLLSMLEKYSKDLNEIAACWQYIIILASISGLSGAMAVGALLVLRGVL